MHFKNSPDPLVQSLKTTSVWTVIGGVCDLFLICMIWFVLDESNRTTIYQDSRQSYAIMDVIQPKTSISDTDLNDTEPDN